MNYFLLTRVLKRGCATATLGAVFAFSSAFAREPIKLKISPIIGQSQYPLVVQGLREVLISDLGKDPAVVLSSVGDADLSLEIYVQDEFQDVKFSMSLMDQEKRYNLGTKKFLGNYTDVKTLQNKLFITAEALLRSGVDEKTSTKILSSHTKNMYSVHQLGNASSFLSQNKFSEAVSSLDAAVKSDPTFESGRDRATQMNKKIATQTRDLGVLARIHESEGNPEKALEQYNAALKLNSRQPAVLVNKARLLSNQGQYEEAVNLLKEAIRLDANHAESHAVLGKIYLQQGKVSEAGQSLTMSVQLGSQDPTVYDTLGQIYQKSNKGTDAARMYQKAGDLSANIADLRNSQRFYRQAQENERSIELTVKEADAYIKAGDLEVALQFLNRQLISNVDNDALISLQAYALFLNKQSAQGLKRAYAALELNPKNYLANYVAGLILSNDVLSLRDAAKYLEIAKSLKPDQPDPSILLAQVYSKLDRREDAVRVLAEMARIRPRDVSILLKLGDAHLANMNMDDAYSAYQKVIDIAPHIIEAHEGLALIYIERKDREKLLEKLATIFELDATDNLLIRNGASLFANLLPAGLISYVEKMPKSVGDGIYESFINQVSLVKIEPANWFRRVVFPYFKFYYVDHKLVLQDLTLALFSKYRLVPPSQVPGITRGFILEKDLKDAKVVGEICKHSKLDGLFGYTAEVGTITPTLDKVILDLILHSDVDKGLHGTANKALLPSIAYPHGVAVKFNPLVAVNYLIALFLTLGPILGLSYILAKRRGWGVVKVTINYDPSLESFLTLKLSTTEITPKDTQSLIVSDKQQADKKKFKSLLKQKGTFVQQMVGKTTFFDKVPARDYYCYLFGTIEDTSISKRTVGNYFMFQQFKLVKNEVKEIIFQLEREEAYVMVHAILNEASVAGVEIAIKETKDVKYTRGEQGAFFYLKKGKYTLRARHQGKDYYQELTVDSLADVQILFNLSDVAQLSETVHSKEDILQKAEELKASGRTEDAVTLLQATGQDEQAYELSADTAISEGDYEKAALVYAKAKDFLRAADAWKNHGNDQKYNEMMAAYYLKQQDYKETIPYLEGCGNLTMLAKVYQKLGDEKMSLDATARDFLQKGAKLEAAQVYMKAEEFSKAAELYEEMDQGEKAASLYARAGNFEMAAQLFLTIGDQKRAAMSYEKGGYHDEATNIYESIGDHEKVVSLLIASGNFLRAAKKLISQAMVDDAISMLQKVPPKYSDYEETQILLANLIAKKGMKDLALKTLQKVERNFGANFDLETQYLFAELSESAGEKSKALEIFESLMTRDFHFKDVEQRIQTLKAKIASASNPSTNPNTNAGSTISGGAPVYQTERRYEIMNELGRGGMGVVYKAKDKKLDRIVAFKTLPHSLHTDPEALASLQREAQLAAKLHHPNIVTVFDVGEEAGDYYIAMEFVDGKTLQDILVQIKRLNKDAFSAIFKPLCAVIQFAHDHQIIHRDLKPSNILISPKTKTVKLMDFGLAKVLENLSIDKTMLRGTPLYISPEQILGQDIDKRTDIYSLGVMMYECLVGTPPFTKGDIMYAHLHTAPEPIQKLLPTLSPEIANMVMKCLEKNKANRPESAAEVAKVL